MGQMKQQALKDLENYMESFDDIIEKADMDGLSEEDLNDFWEDFATEAPEDSKDTKKEEVKKKDLYYLLGPTISKTHTKGY